MTNRLSIRLALLAVVAALATACGIYSFSGTSIQPDIKTVTINYFEYKALRVDPALSNDLTEALKDKFQKMTRLEQVEEEGDIEISDFEKSFSAFSEFDAELSLDAVEADLCVEIVEQLTEDILNATVANW